MGPWAWNHLLAWGGPEMLSRGGGVKNGLQGGRMATYPPHAHLCKVVKLGGETLKVG